GEVRGGPGDASLRTNGYDRGREAAQAVARAADGPSEEELIADGNLIVAAWFGLHRIAEAKNETTVGGGVFRLDESRPEDMEAFRVLLAQITKMDDPALADRLERLRGDGEIWVAPKMGPDRWAVFVD